MAAVVCPSISGAVPHAIKPSSRQHNDKSRARTCPMALGVLQQHQGSSPTSPTSHGRTAPQPISDDLGPQLCPCDGWVPGSLVQPETGRGVICVVTWILIGLQTWVVCCNGLLCRTSRGKSLLHTGYKLVVSVSRQPQVQPHAIKPNPRKPNAKAEHTHANDPGCAATRPKQARPYATNAT